MGTVHNRRQDAAASNPILQRAIDLVAELEPILRRLQNGDTFGGTDIPPRSGKEGETWRGEEDTHEFSDRIPIAMDGDSSWLEQQVQELVKIIRRKEKRSKLLGRSNESSRKQQQKP